MKKVKEQDLQDVNPISENDNKQEVKHYDYGHLVMFCGKCGSKYIVEENVPGNQARQIILPPTNTAGLRLVCKDCNNEMSLFYIESTKKKEDESKEAIQEEEKSNESVPEESTIKE